MRYSILVLISFLLASNFILSQNKAIDKLEMYYDQGHYKLVLKRANKLIDKPEYDFSYLPSLYKSMALFQLSKNESWYKRHPFAIDEAKELFIKVKESKKGKEIFDAHIFEIASLKKDLTSWLEDLKRKGNRQAFEYVQEIMGGLFDNIPDIEQKTSLGKKDILSKIENSNESIDIQKKRENVIELAKRNLGVPYLWAGNDPNGFDCSGFTSYVLKNTVNDLPRSAQEQYNKAIKIEKEVAQKGDLIFFDNGAGISHVGIVASDQGKPLIMIHASSSQGIIITEIETSPYWQKRISGFGTFIIAK